MKKKFGQFKIELGHGCQMGQRRDRMLVFFLFGQITIDFKCLTHLFWKKRKWKSDKIVISETIA